jgi:hypothetical protein
MREKIEKILGIVCIILAVYSFDRHNANQCIVSVLLLATGILTLSKNEKLKKYLRLAAAGLAILLMIRLWLYG